MFEFIFTFQLDELNDGENDRPPKKVVRPAVASKLAQASSDKLQLSSAQQLRRRKKTLTALRPIHCSNETKKGDEKPVVDGIWTTLIGTATKKGALKLHEEL